MIRCAPGPRRGREVNPGRRWRAVQLPGLLEAQRASPTPPIAGDIELVERLLASADAVVWSRRFALGRAGQPAPQQILERHPHLVVTAITPFGLDGPWRDRAATEFTLQAWSGGALGIGRGEQYRAPAHVGGQVGDWLAGAYAAALTLAFAGPRTARRPRRTGRPVDAGGADPRPHLLSGDVLRDAGPAVADRTQADGARGGAGRRRSGRARLRYRAAVVRSVCDVRASGVDRRDLDH